MCTHASEKKSFIHFQNRSHIYTPIFSYFFLSGLQSAQIKSTFNGREKKKHAPLEAATQHTCCDGFSFDQKNHCQLAVESR